MRFFRRAPRAEPDPGFQQLLAEMALSTFERQVAFQSWVEGRDWQLDQDAGELRLGDTLLPAQLLGSYADRSRTWLWAWANDSIEPRMMSAASLARSIGEQREIAVLTEPEIDIDRVGTEGRLATVTAGLIDGDAMYPCPYAGGVAYAVVDLPPSWPAPSGPAAERAVHVVTEALAQVPEIVSRASIERFLEEIGANASSTAQEIRIGDEATFGFDELGRLTSIEATLEPSS